MKLLRLLVLLTCLVLLVIVSIWWNWPHKVDMAAYAPADALVYIELNSIPDVTKAIKQGEVFKTASSVAGVNSNNESSWTVWAARAGLAPAQAVVFARAQMALVVVDIDRQANGDALRVKPEAALIVETQTAKWRMKSVALENVKQLAQFAYGATDCTERSSDSQYIECVAAGGSRKILAAIDGTTVIIGNSERAVQSCLAVRRGQRPKLSDDSEFTSTRTSLKDESSLAFGYVSQTNAARLVSLGIPLLVGKEPGDSQFENLLSDSAAKILRGIAWTSKANAGMIEDHYQIALDQAVTKRLDPVFQIAGNENDEMWQLVPNAFRAVSIYRSSEPQAAWMSLNSSLAMKLDAVSTVLIASLLKSSLASYGVENPKDFLAAMAAPLVTIRLALGNDSLLLGRVKNEEQLRKALADFMVDDKGQILNGLEHQPNRAKEFTALFTSGFVVLGKTENILVYLDQLKNKEMIPPARAQSLTLSKHPGAAVITYSNEDDSVRSVITAITRLNRRPLSDAGFQEIDKRLGSIVSCTESRLNENGIDRRTISAFGQFGNLLSLAVADSSTSNKR
jgi:hypothetical protein